MKKLLIAMVLLLGGCGSYNYEARPHDVGDHPRSYYRTHPPQCVTVEWVEEGWHRKYWAMGTYCRKEQ